MQGYYLDPESDVVKESFAAVYAPRRTRGRFPENCVQVCESAAAAFDAADPASNRYAARVVGPARSSEGLRVFYLIAWLD